MDGGQRKTQAQIAEINRTSASLELMNKETNLNYQLTILWNSYKNNLLVLELEKQNIETTRANFGRVNELYQNGQQSSIEFRQTQLNLLNAQSKYYDAKITGKLYEMEINFLLGD